MGCRPIPYCDDDSLHLDAEGGKSMQFPVLGSQFLVLGSWFSVLGSRFLVLGSWFSVLGSRFLVLVTGNILVLSWRMIQKNFNPAEETFLNRWMGVFR
jgi:hypothetical protein